LKIRKTYAYLTILVFFSSLVLGFKSNETMSIIDNNSTEVKTNAILGDYNYPTFSTDPDGLYSMTYLDGSIYGVNPVPSNIIYEYDAVTGLNIDNYTLPFATYGITTDGTNLYSSIYTLTTPNGTIVKMDSTGVEISRIHVTLNTGILHDLAWDGSNLWAFQSVPGCLIQINPTTGIVSKNITISYFPHGITWYDDLIWTVRYGDDRVEVIDPFTGSSVEGFASPYHHDSGIACNGTHLFLSDYITELEVAIVELATAPGEVFLQNNIGVSSVLDIAYGGKSYFVSSNYSSLLRTFSQANYYTGVLSLPIDPVGLTVMFDTHLVVSSRFAPYNIFTFTLDGTLVSNQTALDVMIRSLTFDGTYLWAMGHDNILYKLNPLDMSVVSQFSVETFYGISYDETNDVIWAVSKEDHGIKVINTTTGLLRDEFINLTSYGVGPETGLTYTDNHIVVAKYDSGDYYYYKVNPVAIEDEEEPEPTPTPTPTPSENETLPPGYFIPGVPGYVEDLIAVGIGIVFASLIAGIIAIIVRSKNK